MRSSLARRFGLLAILVAFFALFAPPCAGQADFIRGDANGDGVMNLGDPIWVLAYLFTVGPLLCLDAQDINDDGSVNLADAVYGLSYLFSSGPTPPPPWPDYGSDPTNTDLLDCAVSTAAPASFTCTQVAGSLDATLTWTEPAPYIQVSVRRDGFEIGLVPGGSGAFLATDQTPGTFEYSLVGIGVSGESAPVTCTLTVEPVPVPEVVQAIDGVLANPLPGPALDAALDALAQEIADIYDSYPDPNDAVVAVALSELQAVQTDAQLQAVLDVMLNGPDVTSVPPLGPQPGSAATLCNPIRVYFVNGMWTTRLVAQDSTTQLATAVLQAPANQSSRFEFELFYNHSDVDLVSDLTPVCQALALQILPGLGCNSSIPTFPALLCNLYDPSALSLQWFSSACAALGYVPDALWVIAEWITSFTQVWTPNTQVLSLRQKIHDSVDAGYRVILVPHSRGNFLVKAAMTQLSLSSPSSLNHVGVVAVASPTDYLLSWSYGAFAEFMLPHDILTCVVPLGESLHATTPAGYTNPVSNTAESELGSGCGGPLDVMDMWTLGAAVHKIQWSYLWYPSSRDPIVNAILDQANTLPAPAADPCHDLTFVGVNAQGYEEYEREIDPSGVVDPITLIRIPGTDPGEVTFNMGQVVYAEPVHPVTLTQDYLISKYEITNAQYKYFCDETGFPFPPTNLCCGMPTDHFTNPLYADHPVVMVSWDDLNATNGFLWWTGLDLPTEAQWEYAARGTDGRTFPWGSQDPALGAPPYRANYCPGGYPNCAGDGFQYTSPVGATPFDQFAGPFGALDQAGNVWEWVADRWGSYPAAPVTDPTGPPTGSNRVSRGGSWDNNATLLQSAVRYDDPPSDRDEVMGFRPARVIP